MAATLLIEELLQQVTAALAEQQRFPEATYRLQFHAGFTFRAAAALVPYLHELGITDLYASPYLKARPGSQHGYDISDHRVLNPEIGSEEDHAALSVALQTHGMGQLLDVVPNHMGIVGNQNVWWNDVLENGPSSPYASFFDIDWQSSKPPLHNKVLLPLLGDPYGKVLESGQIRLAHETGIFAVYYFDHRFPVEPGSYLQILHYRVEELEKALGAQAAPFIEYQSIMTALSHLPPCAETNPARVAERQREKEVIKRRLAELTEREAAVRDFIGQNVTLFNGRPNEAASFDLLDDLLNVQAYRLSYWRVAADEINYRRFFDVNELAALSMEKPEVFAATHELIGRLLREGKVTGLRIDHPDGLYDPAEYLRRLQKRYVLERARALFEARPEPKGQAWSDVEGPLLDAIRAARREAPGGPLERPLYVVVEKILGKGEPLPEDWPVHGTTGYEFLNVLNGLFVEGYHAKDLSRIYSRWTESDASLHDLVYQKKFLILQVSLSSELHMLAYQLDRLSEKDRWARDFTRNSLRHALREVIACFPVYRSYITSEDVHSRDKFYIETAVGRARRKNPAISARLFDYVRDMVLLRPWETARTRDRHEQRRFVGKFQQVTSPVMAKGLEDTSFYVYNRLVSLNEVGGDPDQFGVPPAAFHRHNQERQALWPRGLSATATHDTKRGEDLRARLNVLSELPQEWQRRLSLWHRLNRKHHIQLDDLLAPDRNDEYLLYQTLLGAWPLEPYTAEQFAEFVRRIQDYMQKAVHEAKVHTSWINPNPAYDDAVRHFVAQLLDAQQSGKFLADLQAFQRRISHYGLFNSLAQTLLKITAPGVPDTYQGTELWDFSLVDPDNRRPVDYELRQRLLSELKARLGDGGMPTTDLARELTQAKEDGRIKLYLTWRALRFRRAHPGLFTVGAYQPADVVGSRYDHACGFVRRLAERRAAVVVPRLLTHLIPQTGDLPLGAGVWEDTAVVLPETEPGRRWANVFTGQVLTAAERDGRAALPLAEVLASFPVALLVAQD